MEEGCQSDALTWNGVCSDYMDGAWCYQDALHTQAPFCEYAGDFGAFLYNVGRHYCG